METIRCVVYTPDVELGLNKLREIEKEKINKGVSLIKKGIYETPSLYGSVVYLFSDNEEWVLLSGEENTIGTRWHKACIDTRLTKRVIDTCILPCGGCFTEWHNPEYFSEEDLNVR